MRPGVRAMLMAVVLGGCLTIPMAKAGEVRAPDAPESDFRPPPEFRERTRGNKVVYCQKTTNAGSRTMTEKCYDEIRLRELLLQRELDRRDLDQRRRLIPVLSY